MMRYFTKVEDNFRKNPDTEITLPTRATEHSVGYDFYSPIDIIIPPQTSVMIWTDVKVAMEPDDALLLNVRSSMGKQPIMIANTQGWIESDYFSNAENDGNIGFRLFNLGNTNYIIRQGDRIGQGMFIKYLIAENGNTNTIRTGGFGSSGN